MSIVIGFAVRVISAAVCAAFHRKSSLIFRLIKPGPAIDASDTKSSSLILGKSSVAISRGFLPATRAITIAAFVEKSPKSRLRGTSNFAAKPNFSFNLSDTYLYRFIFYSLY